MQTSLSTQSGRKPAYHYFAVLTASSTFLLIIAGALVTGNEAGLAVPDWPLSYNSLMPPMEGNIRYEHGHRVVATFVGFLTTVLAVWLWRKEPRECVRNLGYVGLEAVITQGILGGITVLFYLPTVVSVLHATLAQTFFCLIVCLAWITGYSGAHGGQSLPPDRSKLPLQPLKVWITVSIYAALFAGTLLRNTEYWILARNLVLSLVVLLICWTVARISVSVLWVANSVRLAPRIGCREETSQISLLQLGVLTTGILYLQLILGAIFRHSKSDLGIALHIIGALVAAVLVAWTLARIWRYYQDVRSLSGVGAALGFLLLIQICLGVASYVMRIMMHGAVQPMLSVVVVTTTHVAIGALVLVTSLLLTFQIYRVLQSLIRVPGFSSEPQKVSL